METLIDPHSKSLASGLAVFSAMALTAFGQKLPDPLVYFALDEAAGATVAVDGTGNGYDGTVVNSVTFGEAGAPGGSTPSGAARFTDGILNVPTFDVPALLGNRDGAGAGDAVSYTMAAWIKPDAASLAGDRFFIGQSAQGIHNGLRQNGRLHQAHWGNDHYGNTLLNDTDWVHATFVYDGAADLGTIYLNGTADSDPAAKASPNGTGNLIIGGRQGNQNGGGGQAWYNGLIDDLAIWDSILTDVQIQALADGMNPFSPVTGEDNENGGAGDGMDDGWEVANGLDPAVDDSAGNPDNDGLTNLEEWNGDDNSTDPMDADSDDDDLTDGAERNTHNTDPNDADSDDDGLNDGAEIAANTDPLDPDSDKDEMSDGYEVASGHDPLLAADAAQDKDNDGSLNLEECQRGTDPNEQDTDMDGLSDGVEDGGGTFVNAMMTGTDPLDPDTDDDNLLDGVETGTGIFVDATNTGTDPNKKDTDEDLVDDDIEIREGFDPTDGNSTPLVSTITILDGLIGGDLTDPEDDGVEGPTVEGPPQTAGENWNWISITSSEEQGFEDFAGGEGAFNVFDNLIGGGQNKWCCGGPAVSITVEFEDPVSITHFTLTSSNDTPGRDPLDFEIQGSDDGVTFEAIYTRSDDVSIWTARNQTARIDLPTASNPYKFIRYDVTRTGLTAGAVHALNEIEYFGDTSSTPLTITEINHDAATGKTEITWNSRANRTYAVDASDDLIGWNELDDGVDSEGETTSFSDFAPVGAPRRFYRVRETQ